MLQPTARKQLGFNDRYFAQATYHAPILFSMRQQATAPHFRMGFMLLMDGSAYAEGSK
jgi:hypothetical protein